MTIDFLLPLIMRWIHIFSAVLVVGGIVFYRWVYLPAVEKVLSPEDQEALRVPLMKRWKPIIHPPIILFLVSGFYNYFAVTRLLHEDQPLYHALFGVKFLLALPVFALVIIDTSTMAWSEKLRKSGRLWPLLTVLALVVVAIGGYMRVMPTTGP